MHFKIFMLLKILYTSKEGIERNSARNYLFSKNSTSPKVECDSTEHILKPELLQPKKQFGY